LIVKKYAVISLVPAISVSPAAFNWFVIKYSVSPRCGLMINIQGLQLREVARCGDPLGGNCPIVDTLSIQLFSSSTCPFQ
jgi:hypothetical protein